MIPSSVNNSGDFWIGWSYLLFNPNILNFQSPSGILLHKEAYKLLPNYGIPNADFAPNYEVERGGVYPSMSKNNVLNLYLNIIWSAEKGDSVNS